MWLQNAGFIWVPLIMASTAAAWFGMDDLADRHAGMAEQAVVFTRRHNWLMCWLYLGTFGSFIGFSASLPMLAQSQYQRADAMHLVWLGPLIGAVLRPLGGWMADRWGGARVTFWVFVLMALAALVALLCLPTASVSGSEVSSNGYTGFLAAFGLLFAASGIGNGSTFRMISSLFVAERLKRADELRSARAQAAREGAVEAAAALGFASAIGAYGDHRQRVCRAGHVHRLLPFLHRVDLVGVQPPQRALPLLVHFLKPARGRALPRTTI
jgi:NNP family nitrate/nitrite transporter-like MFS transporter